LGIFEIGSQTISNYLSGLALNHSPPDCCLLRSWDYRGESSVPGANGCFWGEVSHLCPPGPSWSICAPSSSWDVRHTLLGPAIGWGGVLKTFCPGWPQTSILISVFQVAMITGVSHHAWLPLGFAWLTSSFLSWFLVKWWWLMLTSKISCKYPTHLWYSRNTKCGTGA
jgi:hypothetical protein